MGNINICKRSNRSAPTYRTIVPNHTVLDIDQNHKSHPNHGFKSNEVATTKYTILTFLPKNLFEQFHRLANLYFIFVIAVNWIPEIQTFGKEITMIPLLFVLVVSGVKDAIEDFQRFQSDKKINRKHCRIYSRQEDHFVGTEWRHVQAGDLIHLACNEIIPADILLLKSSDVSGICHVETSNLDGETNLKQRQCISHISFAADDPHIKTFKHPVHCELPNSEIYKFHGYITTEDEQICLSQNNLLLRGCTIRNTDYVEGIVVYAGTETKALLNNRNPRYKRSKLERQINRDVIYCVIVLLCLCFFCAVGSGIWLGTYENSYTIIFIPYEDQESYNPLYQGFIVFFTYIILFQSVIPLPLYVSIELVKLAQIYFLHNDIELYYEPSNKRMECRALNITEDLGQIDYLFSDKTGTLTENQMDFKCCTIGGYDFPHSLDLDEESDIGSRYSLAASSRTGSIMDNLRLEPTITRELSNGTLRSLESVDIEITQQSRRIRDFFLLMAVCNTVVVSTHPHNDMLDDCGAEVESNLQNAATTDQSSDRYNSLETSLRKKSSLPPLNFPMSRCGTPPRNHSMSGLPTFPPMDSRPSELSLPGAALRSEYPNCLTPSEGSIAASSIVSEITAQTRYEAESPDELALVRAAATYGCCLTKRSSDKVTVWLPYMESEIEYESLEIIEFDSTRKRMSVIIRSPLNGEITLLTKGADTAILGILDRKFREDKELKKFVRETEDLITHYAMQGLRTLCMARKNLTKKQYKIWRHKHRLAELSLENREEKLLSCICDLEKDLELIGATGIEDKLQEGVPETIAKLREAGIKVWIITGDKQETAIEIAYASHLFDQEHKLIILNARDLEETKKFIESNINEIKRELKGASLGSDPSSQPEHLFSLIIDGKTLSFALEESLKKLFLALCERCSSVVCCRATPIQKGMVVKLVRESLNKLTLAIGDGANDVSMIQMADVGIGISGQEGMQAVMASDFAIARFRFLERLLLVHGHWSYVRLGKFAIIMFLKSLMSVFIMFWFQLFSGLSGSTNIDSINLLLMNAVFTAAPPVINGILDKDLAADTLLKFPKLYGIGPQNKIYTKFSYFFIFCDTLYQTFVIYIVCHYSTDDTNVGIWEMGTNIFTILLIAILLTIAIETHSWVWIQWLCLVLSFVVYWMCAIIIDSFWIDFDHPVTPYWIMHNTIAKPIHMFLVLLACVLALLPRFTFRIFQMTIYPDDICQYQLWEKSQEMNTATERKHSLASSTISERTPNPELADVDIYNSQNSLIYGGVQCTNGRSTKPEIREAKI